MAPTAVGSSVWFCVLNRNLRPDPGHICLPFVPTANEVGNPEWLWVV